VDPLVSITKKIAGPTTTVFMSYEDRSVEFPHHGVLVDRFFASMAQEFVVREVSRCDMHPDFVSPEIRLFSLKRKSDICT
jgi:hypothetical protein